MMFNDLNLLGILARQHQQELIAAAAERRLVRLSRRTNARNSQTGSGPPPRDAA